MAAMTSPSDVFSCIPHLLNHLIVNADKRLYFLVVSSSYEYLKSTQFQI